VPVLVFVVGSAAAAGVLAAIIPARNAPINVRWRPDLTPSQRLSFERRFRLSAGHQAEGTTWSYDLADSSFANIRAIVRDPVVEDTAHINRRFFRPEFGFDREARVTIGALLTGTALAILALVRSSVPAAIAPVEVQERTLLRIVGAGPAVLITISILMLLAATLGYHPLWANGRQVTLAEAAHGGDAATVFRMLSAGSDPNVAEAVPIERRAEPIVLTPLEAAVESRQVEVVDLLVRMGARASDADRVRLACLATAVDAPEVFAYLRTTIPAGGNDCGTVSLPAH
jgi:hypothetical protein